MKKATLVVFAIILGVLITIDKGHAATDLYLLIPGVPGEATQAHHANWISVDTASWTHGVSPAGTAGPKVLFEGLTLEKQFDRSSPTLALAAADGRRFQSATLDFQRAGAQTGAQQIHLKVVLTDVTVKSYSSAFHSAANIPLPNEQVKLGFGKIEWVYFKQNPDGSLSPGARAGWDVLNNRAF